MCKKSLSTCVPGYDLVGYGNRLACEAKCASGSFRDIDPNTGRAIGKCKECVPINNFDYKLNELGNCVGTGKCVAGYELTTSHGCKAICPGNAPVRDVDGNCAPENKPQECSSPDNFVYRMSQNVCKKIENNCIEGHELVLYRQAKTTACEPNCLTGEFRQFDKSGRASSKCIRCDPKDNATYFFDNTTGNCIPDGWCVDGFEKINGQCVQKCEPGHIRDVSGACVTKCSDGHENLKGSCVPFCTDGRVRDKYGLCVFENEGKPCEGNYGLFRNNICKKRETPLKIYCSDGQYKNTLNDKNNCVEDRSICGETYEKVNNECVKKCANGLFRDKKDQNKCVADGDLCNIMSSGRIGRYYEGICTVTNECKYQYIYAKDMNGNDKCADRGETVRVYNNDDIMGAFTTMTLQKALSEGRLFEFIKYYKDYRV